MHNAYAFGDPMSADPFCCAYKTLYDHILNKLHSELPEVESNSAEIRQGRLNGTTVLGRKVDVGSILNRKVKQAVLAAAVACDARASSAGHTDHNEYVEYGDRYHTDYTDYSDYEDMACSPSPW